MKRLIPTRLIPIFEFIGKYAPYYSVYLNATIVQFFTKTRIGYWFYFSIFLFAPVQLDAQNFLLIIYVAGASVSLAIVKSSYRVSSFLEKRLEKNAMNSIIKESPAWIIINALKPFLFLSLLVVLINYTEMHRISYLNCLLLSDYLKKWASSENKEIAWEVVHDIVFMTTAHSGLKGGLTQLKSRLLQLPYLSLSLLSILMVIVILLWLKEKKK